MSKPKMVLGLLGAFLVGCVASQMTALVVPPARAGTLPQKWEYFCRSTISQGRTGDELAATTFNAAGAQGWEMVGVAATTPDPATWCFKRPLP